MTVSRPTARTLALGRGLLRSAMTLWRGGAPWRGLRRRGMGAVAAVRCRTPAGQRRRWRVGPRRVTAGSQRRAVKVVACRGATVRCGRGRWEPANGLAGGVPRGHGDGKVSSSPLSLPVGPRLAEVDKVGTGKGPTLSMIPHF